MLISLEMLQGRESNLKKTNIKYCLFVFLTIFLAIRVDFFYQVQTKNSYMSKFPTIELNPNKKYDSKLSFLSPHILITLPHFIFFVFGGGVGTNFNHLVMEKNPIQRSFVKKKKKSAKVSIVYIIISS
jgi:hypothetical protein